MPIVLFTFIKYVQDKRTLDHGSNVLSFCFLPLKYFFVTLFKMKLADAAEIAASIIKGICER
ncbi:hypothetical protein QUF94_23235 [Peribacillus sp. NJ4]|nr:hypothetical protein [Peribacillus sp. NJ4]